MKFLSDLSQELRPSVQNISVSGEKSHPLAALAGDEEGETLQELELRPPKTLHWTLQRKRLLGLLSSQPVCAPGEFPLQPSDGLSRPSLTLLQTVQLTHRHRGNHHRHLLQTQSPLHHGQV